MTRKGSAGGGYKRLWIPLIGLTHVSYKWHPERLDNFKEVIEYDRGYHKSNS